MNDDDRRLISMLQAGIGLLSMDAKRLQGLMETEKVIRKNMLPGWHVYDTMKSPAFKSLHILPTFVYSSCMGFSIISVAWVGWMVSYVWKSWE